MNEMKDLLQLRLDTPTVDRSVSVFHGVRLRFANVTSAYTIPEFHLLLLPTYPSSVRPFFRPLAPQTESFLGEAVPFVPFFNNCVSSRITSRLLHSLAFVLTPDWASS
jgi:hypothetical protein